MALSAGRITKSLVTWGRRNIPMKGGGTIIYAGSLVMIDTSGYARPAHTTAAAYGAGVACTNGGRDRWTNDDNDGDVLIEIEAGIFGFDLASGDEPLNTDYGKINYMYDDETIARTSNTGARKAAGRTVMVEGGQCFTMLSPEVGRQAIELVPSDLDLASTSNGEGASLIGVEDSGSLLTAATVEAALAEIVKKSNAGLVAPWTTHVYLSLCASAAVVAKFSPDFAGKIKKTAVQAVRAVTTASKSGVFRVVISDTALSGGSVSTTSANLNALGAIVSGASVSGKNAFTAGQVIYVDVSDATQFGEGEVMLQIFMDSA